MGIFLTENAIKQGGNPHIRKTVLTAGTKGNMVIMQSGAMPRCAAVWSYCLA